MPRLPSRRPRRRSARGCCGAERSGGGPRSPCSGSSLQGPELLRSSSSARFLSRRCVFSPRPSLPSAGASFEGIACITDRAEIPREREIFSSVPGVSVRQIVGCDSISIFAGMLGYLLIFLFVCGRNIFLALFVLLWYFFSWLARENR